MIASPDPKLTQFLGQAEKSVSRLIAGLGQVSDFLLENGRSGGIRTHDPLTPSQVRYRAALRSDLLEIGRAHV